MPDLGKRTFLEDQVQHYRLLQSFLYGLVYHSQKFKVLNFLWLSLKYKLKSASHCAKRKKKKSV